jgi:hypothetical protein
MALMIVCLTGCATITKSLEIQRSEFVLVNVDEAGRISLVASNRVPFVTGQGYGWQMFLKTDKPRIRWREEFTLPRAPEIWGQGETSSPRPSSSTCNSRARAEAPGQDRYRLRLRPSPVVGR